MRRKIFWLLALLLGSTAYAADNDDSPSYIYKCIRDNGADSGGVKDMRIILEVSDDKLLLDHPRQGHPQFPKPVQLAVEELTFTRVGQAPEFYANASSRLWQYTFRDVPTQAHFELLGGFSPGEAQGDIRFRNVRDNDHGVVLRNALFRCTQL